MCGRFTLTQTGEAIALAFGLPEIPNFNPRYNIAPSQSVAAIASDDQGGGSRLEWFRWGLIPFWAKDPKIGNKLINARIETLTEKPSFRSAFKHRRCLILADGFYEWKLEAKDKKPYYFHLPNHQLFAFAGLWEVWHSPAGEEIKSCVIVTTAANEGIKFIHSRMPIILSPEAYPLWLDPSFIANETILSSSQKLEFFPVDKIVNNPKNDNPNCLKAISYDN